MPSGKAAPEHSSPGSEALEKLKRDEYTFEQYIDDRVEAAIQRLGRLIVDEEREALKDILRGHALTDPVIQEYLLRALGREFTPESE